MTTDARPLLQNATGLKWTRMGSTYTVNCDTTQRANALMGALVDVADIEATSAGRSSVSINAAEAAKVTDENAKDIRDAFRDNLQTASGRPGTGKPSWFLG